MNFHSPASNDFNHHHMNRRFLLFLATTVFLAPLASAQFTFGDGAAADEAAKSDSKLVAEVKSIAPGQPFSVALQLDHPDEWHSYYKNSGGPELPPTIQWKLPEGFSAGPLQFPVPTVKDGFFGKSFVYTGSPVFLVEIQTPSLSQPGQTVTLTANADWQICKESCINEHKSFTLTLPITATAETDPAQAVLFKNARAKLPRPDSNLQVSAQTAGDNVALRISASDGPFTDFVPDQPFLKSASAGGSIAHDGATWLVTLQRKKLDALDKPIPPGPAVSGILVGAESLAVPLTTIAAPPAEAVSFAKFLPILGGMMLGGLILNLMPCVFPVIGLKIMGFVQQAGSDRKKIALHGVAFALGVFACFAVLSGILFVAKLGWGYQLQNPWVVLSLMLLMFLLALNMFGVFEIGASATSVGGSLQTQHGVSGTFFSGVLATVVATPCSAPFLGAAIGAAIALPAFQFFTAFAAMAAGLALPYLVLSLFPQLIDYLPRPGAWMESFKQSMSFLLFATAGYLLWVYGGIIDYDNLLGPVFGLSAIAIAAWIYGRWHLPYREKSTRRIALILTLAFAAAGFLLSKPPGKSAIAWEPWSEDRVATLLSEGKPVYIDFTAKWCATCQVNKKRAYTKDVVALMKQKGIVALKADKTKPDPEIEAALQKLGRTAIPVNVLLAPGKKPVILPELLSPADVATALKDL